MLSAAASSAGRPDLEEFLSALSGFLPSQPSGADPSQLRFLGIFLRSVGADKGHLLTGSDAGRLTSVLSHGIGDGFDADFNASHPMVGGELSPLESSFRQQDVIAVSDVSREPSVPSWFLGLMRRHKLVSLVSVPLAAQGKPLGLLCAYYQDVCVYDSGTLAHLAMIGRMAGAMIAPPEGSMGGAGLAVAHRFLLSVSEQTLTPIQLYDMAARSIEAGVSPHGLIGGPLRKAQEGVCVTVAAASAVLGDRMSMRVALSSSVLDRVGEHGTVFSRQPGEACWDDLMAIAGPAATSVLVAPVRFRGKTHGAFVCWRNAGTPFSNHDAALVTHLCGLLALAGHRGA